jgi:hypothetical protein
MRPKGDNFGSLTAGSVGKPYRDLSRIARTPRSVPKVAMDRAKGLNQGDTEGLHPRPGRVTPVGNGARGGIPSFTPDAQKDVGKINAYSQGGLVKGCSYSKRKG